jgi:hypothetical protein
MATFGSGLVSFLQRSERRYCSAFRLNEVTPKRAIAQTAYALARNYYNFTTGRNSEHGRASATVARDGISHSPRGA